MSSKVLTKVSKSKLSYLADVCVSTSQVFLGLTAASTFIGPFDIGKLPVVLLTLALAIVLVMIGWRILR